jgi:dTDP-4-dehydrorhamnose reductase
MSRILIIGGDSRIGATVAAQMKRRGCRVFKTTRHTNLISSDTVYLDLSAPLSHWQPPAVDACLLAGAVTSLKQCEDTPRYSERVNVAGSLLVAEKLRALGTYVLFLSSNQVFDGSLPRVTAETPVNPLTLYGMHKAKVEAVLSGWKNSAGILRITKVLDEHDGLLQHWKSSLLDGQSIQAFADYFMAPVPMSYVVNTIAGILQSPVEGIIQLSGDDDVSYFDTATRLAAELGIRGGVKAVSAVKSKSLAHVPSYTSLDCSRIEAISGEPCPSSSETVLQTLASLSSERVNASTVQP